MINYFNILNEIKKSDRLILLLYFTLLNYNSIHSQVTIDKQINTCASHKSGARLMYTSNTVSDNQKMIDISYYKLEIDINLVEQHIHGSVTVEGNIISEEPDIIELDLSGNLTVDSVLYLNNLWDFIHLNDKVQIMVPNNLNDDKYFSFEIIYQGRPTSTGFGSFNFSKYRGIDHVWTLSEPYGSRDWWPCKDDPSDKADSVDIIITLPSDQIAVSNGLLVNQIDLENDRKKFHWVERYPISTYLVSITTYPYREWTDEYIGVNGDTLPLYYYVYPDHYDMVYDNYMTTKDMLYLFEKKFGEYPFINEKYGHVEFIRGGGMEHQTISSLGGHSQWLIAHELAHQWWGNLITCESFHHIWLNEGFARFSEALWQESIGGNKAYKEYWIAHAYYGSGTIFVEEPTSAQEIFNGNLTYNKAGWVVHMLRGVMGDSIFYEALKSYGTSDSLSYNSASTSDFQKVCENTSGLDLEQFFQQWIYGEYYPKYELFWHISDKNELIVEINQIQNWQYFRMPIQLEVIMPGDTILFKVGNQHKSEEYNLGILDNTPYAVYLDPDNWILKEIIYSNNILPAEPKIIIYPAYPNPFNSQTVIRYFIPEYLGEVESFIRIFDVRGNFVYEVETDRWETGYRVLNWKPQNNASGTYFIQFASDKFLSTQKIVLIK